MDSFTAYQHRTHDTAVYPHSGTVGAPLALSYVTLGLNGEAGEVADHIAGLLRDDNGIIDADRRALFLKELGDVTWYVSELAYHLRSDLSALAGDPPVDSIAAFQSRAKEIENYPHRDYVGSPAALAWLSQALNASAGAVADQVKKVLRDDDGNLSAERHITITAHLRRVLWALSELSRHLQEPYGRVLAENIAKLADRRARGTLQGSGDTR